MRDWELEHNYPFLSPRRNLAKSGSVASVGVPPKQMCDQMKGSLIKKQVKLFEIKCTAQRFG